ncbi:LEUCINE-RICH REPEAT-CONTAINING PROTEIN 57 [Salix koriyanagi]|uniref:LEUCINE-RICH REPEAT-CONTAINING PROTEIN 57 n=1 Tax=Salix koriyanagi TaxID=2511006 RepID=A0A9Q0ZZX5_9ROSI|nr:LEUCINE-RICH REPEAT-CONTAINING PROTEIN 57 [Salix koriyanagi]
MNRLIRRLPRSICKLQNLRTLRLYACVQLEELPKDTWKIATLRHLEITSKQEFLPKKGTECLTSLRSLSIHKCYRLSTLVPGMQHWTALQKLSLIDCPRLSSLEFDLNSLISLETLEICNCSVLDLSGRLKKKDEDSLKGRRSLLSLIADLADELKELVQKKTLYRANTVDLDVLTEERSNLNEF